MLKPITSLNTRSKKEKRKKLDMIVANEVFQTEKGFGQVHNSFHIISAEATNSYHDVSKDIFARIFWDEVEKQL
ncbi:MAG: phosphopantothenoylcysteine decarboxylase [Bdellovibrionota bacterium]